jgi:tyrosine-specific transport protein
VDFKLLGSILLIVGTSIGAGMLGLPIAAAELGFTGSLILLFACWFIMTASAFLILEVNLWLPQNNNLISMAKATLGPTGQILSWVTYLLLLYSLLCAYIAGGSDLFHNLLSLEGFDLPLWAASILFTVIFGSIVYLGIHSVDQVNRWLMLIKFSAYFVLVLLLLPFISIDKLATGDLHYLASASAITVTITSFGFAIIVPSLRVYFAGDIKKLKQAILIGSLIPLFIYILWDLAIMGVIPLEGEHSLLSILQSSNSTSDLVNTVNLTVNKSSVALFAKLFTSVCVLTSFLGVALCLIDFFADGLSLEKKGLSNLVIVAVTFLPSLVVTLFFPHIFIKALSFAGIYCIILLILLPTAMAWGGRYHRKIARGFEVMGGKALLIFLMGVSLALIGKALLSL